MLSAGVCLSSPSCSALNASRIYPYPNVAKYTGKGDANDAANYVAVKGPVPFPQAFTNETSKLLGPDNQKFYRAEDNNTKLVIAKK